MLRGMMMDRPLLVSSVIDFAAEVYPDVQVVSQTVEGGIHRYGYAAGARAHRPAGQRAGRRSASSPATGWRRWPGTAIATSSSTTPSPASARSATPSIRGCSPSRSPTSPTTPRTRRCSSTPPSCRWSRRSRPRSRRSSTYVLMTDREHMPAAAKMPRPALLRGPAGRDAAGLHLARVRRERRLRALLHLRHHRRAQGRALFQPLDDAAHLLPDRHAPRPVRAQPHDPAGRAAVPRQCLEPALHRAAHRLPLRPARRQARRTDALRPDGERGRGGRLGRADGLARADRGVQEARAQAQEAHADPERRLGRAAGHDRHPHARLRHRGDARLGHDRDEPGRHAHPLPSRGARQAADGARRPLRQAGPAHVRRRSQGHRREGQPRPAGRADLGRAVRARLHHRLGLLQQPGGQPPSRSTTRAGSAPATSPRSRRTTGC